MQIAEFQELIDQMYSDKDRERGTSGTFMWLIEEVGELASALVEGTPEEKSEEFADVLAWIFTLANVANVDVASALEAKYGSGCPGCGKMTCVCDAKD
ncbi:MAG: nucleotide pyrophosphohydrolase [Planctomycetes bacterium]|nr:nucleotide pyrophosphohydrolase [Planctomycetota bacterium]